MHYRRLTHMNPNTIAKSAPKNNSTLKITGAEAIIRCLLEEGGSDLWLSWRSDHAGL